MLFRIDDDKAVVVEIFHGLEDYEKSLNKIAWTLRGLNDDMAANLLFISICGFKLMFESRLSLDKKKAASVVNISTCGFSFLSHDKIYDNGNMRFATIGFAKFCHEICHDMVSSMKQCLNIIIL